MSSEGPNLARSPFTPGRFLAMTESVGCVVLHPK